MLRRARGANAEQTRLLYKLFSILLRYPGDRLCAARSEILDAVRSLPASPRRVALERFCAYWAHAPATALAQAYVETFDLHKRAGLYLSYYLYGDTRKRGMALLRLKRLYRLAGLILEDGELPDYLPVMLEFAAGAPPGAGEHVLAEYQAALALVHRSLQEMESPYAHLLGAVRGSLPGLTTRQRQRVQELIVHGPPAEQVGLAPYGPPEAMPVEEAVR